MVLTGTDMATEQLALYPSGEDTTTAVGPAQLAFRLTVE